MRKGTGSRILAYVLTLCMIIGSITWPEITAKAETITKDLKLRQQMSGVIMERRRSGFRRHQILHL